MSTGPVAVIDIGSNSIKLLVAARDTAGRIVALTSRTLDARISAGISHDAPELSEESMQRGLGAIRELLATAASFSPRQTILVATSAVRDAGNGQAFRERVRQATGHAIRLLSGDEEANLIGRGLTCDPDLADLRNFYVFDLGGGSLECLAFRDRRIEQAVSLQLGCVRLTEQFVRDSAQPLSPASIEAVRGHVATALSRSFRFSLPPDATAVGTGGTITTFRAVVAARADLPLEKTDTRIEVAQMRQQATELSALSLAERRRVPGMPPARADVFPTALITLCALADAGGFTAFRHSFYNLRFGLAAETLGAS